jgi:catechol 2,3-dioxygenase-like lactoylglutathione lyase family enzyme
MRGRLDHLAIQSNDPERLASFYGKTLRMAAAPLDRGWICRGPDRCVIIVPGEPNRLDFAAYRVTDSRDLAGLRARLRRARVAPEASPTSLFSPGAVALRDPDGNLLVFGLPRARAAAMSGPPARLQHVVVATRAIDRMVAFYTEVIGLRVSDDVRDAEGGLRTCFLRSDEEHHSFAVFQAAENRFDHHCYEVGDWNLIRDWADHFAAQRVGLVWGPGRHGPGNNLFAFIHDPDGNWIEISAELEVVADNRPVGAWPHEERTLNSWGKGLLRS